MVNFINSWAQGIIVAVVISTIIEMILPNGNIKKYVRTVIGAYIVFIIISPIVTKITGKKINLETYKLPETQETNISIDTNAYIENTYINNIKKGIIENIEQKGYKVALVEIGIDRTEENYGKLTSINLKISKEKNDTNEIEPIEINIREEPTKGEEIQSSEIEELKEYLKDNYGTENITIN